MDAKAWNKYKVACLFETVQPSVALWNSLQKFVQAGGGLCLVPGSEDLAEAIKDYNAKAAERGLLPARWERIIKLPANESGRLWASFNPAHPLTAPFQEWIRTGNPDFAAEHLRPRANAFWQVKPVDDKSNVIASFAEEETGPSWWSACWARVE